MFKLYPISNMNFDMRGLSFSSEWGAMKKLGGSHNFFMRNRGVTKKSRDFWMAKHFPENFVQ